MRLALGFLTRFLIASISLFIVWKPIATVYLLSITSSINALGHLTGRPVRYAGREDGWWLIYAFPREDFRLFVGNADIPCLNVLVFIALSAASGFTPWRRGASRLVAGVAALWISHSLYYWLLPHLAIWQYLWSATDPLGNLSPRLDSIAASAETLASSERALKLHRAFASWRNVGMWALAFALWVLLRDRNELPAATDPERPVDARRPGPAAPNTRRSNRRSLWRSR